MKVKELNHVYEYTFTVGIDANDKEPKLDKNSPLENCEIISIRTRRRPVSGGKSLNGAAIVPDRVFDSVFLTIKKGSTEVFDNVPLQQIEQASIQRPHEGYPVAIDGVAWNQSHLTITDTTGLTAGDVIEFTVAFSKKK